MAEHSEFMEGPLKRIVLVILTVFAKVDALEILVNLFARPSYRR